MRKVGLALRTWLVVRQCLETSCSVSFFNPFSHVCCLHVRAARQVFGHARAAVTTPIARSHAVRHLWPAQRSHGPVQRTARTRSSGLVWRCRGVALQCGTTSTWYANARQGMVVDLKRTQESAAQRPGSMGRPARITRNAPDGTRHTSWSRHAPTKQSRQRTNLLTPASSACALYGRMA